MVLLERAIMELSSLTASVTLLPRVLAWRRSEFEVEGKTHIKELGFFFFFRIAVAVSST
jgi:hypothetical protein